MSDNRKYYYLKLKENYFDDDSIVLLESMQDGVLYSNILLKLYLKSLKHGGRLQLDEDIPYTAQMIATITRQQIGTVERALQIFLKLGLVEVLDSGTFYMSNIELLIGQSSTEAERKRAARLQNKALSAPRTNGGHLSDIRPPEIEIELEKEIEIKREIEKGRSARAYGRYQNVFLTDEEMADLQASFPTVWGQYIEKLSEYMASTGKRYQSHAATIRRWSILHSIRTQHLFTGDGFGIIREVEIEHDPVVKDVDRVDKGINDLSLVLHVSHVTLAEFFKPEPHPFAGQDGLFQLFFQNAGVQGFFPGFQFVQPLLGGRG